MDAVAAIPKLVSGLCVERFSRVANQLSSGFHQHCNCPNHRKTKVDEPPESAEEYAARIRRVREEQEAAEERRMQEEAFRKAEQERQRESGECQFDIHLYYCTQVSTPPKERLAAEERQKAKSSKKKAQAKASRQAAENKARAQKERLQTRRSAVFAAARKGDVTAVKKGVWEDEVDAAGGEVKDGCEAFVKVKPNDAHETLSHIAVATGDASLVQWLDAHGKPSFFHHASIAGL